MRYLLLVVALVLTPAGYAKEKDESKSCKEINELITGQIGGGTVLIFVKDFAEGVNGSVLSIDDSVARVAVETLPGDPNVILYIPVCSIRAVGIYVPD